MLESPTDTDTAKKALVRTYRSPSYPDPWDAIQDYERVQAAAAEHPNKGSSALSRVVGLPRSRIRAWVDSDSQPDCYRGLQTAQDHQWIITDWAEPIPRALNCLAAWILSSGSINDNWVPLFVTDDDRDEIDALRSYARIASVRLERTRPGNDRTMEWRPTSDASVLGRVIHTWTDVQGYKTEDQSRFPRYPQYAPYHVTKDFCQVYVQQRGTDTHSTPGFIQIKAERSETFRQALIDCLERVVSDPDLITGSTWPIRIHDPASDNLTHYPEIDAPTDPA